MARSLALEDTRERPFGLRGLAPQTMHHLLPLQAMVHSFAHVSFSPRVKLWLIPTKGGNPQPIRVKKPVELLGKNPNQNRTSDEWPC